MKTIRNKRPGRCAHQACDRKVAIGEGYAVQQDQEGDRNWHLFCTDHVPREPSCTMCGAVPKTQGRHHNTNCGFWVSR